METTLLLWASQSSSSREIAMSNPIPLIPNPNPNPNPNHRPRVEKRSKTPNPNPKTKVPQRGLGVAQLERIRRLQEHDPVGAYTYPLARIGVPVAFPATAAPSLIGYGSASTIRSSLHEQYSLDRVRIGANPYLQELPSNQRGTGIGMAVCLFEHCDFCVNKKRPFSENLGFHGPDRYFSAMDSEMQESREKFAKKIREYDFFPNNSNSTNGDPTAGVFAPGAAGDGSLLDLTLKL